MVTINDLAGIASERESRLRIRTTMPDELLRHDISDEELEALAETRRDHLWEGMWVSLGSAIGFLPTTIISIYSAYVADEKTPIALTSTSMANTPSPST